MGDRANIVVKQSGGEIWLYGHWSGESYAHRLRDALARKIRWDDESYLARIIFEQMIGKEQFGSERGYGISTGPTDNNNPILVVDVKEQRVFFAKETKTGYGPPQQAFTFAEYAALSVDDVEKALEKARGKPEDR